MSVTVTLEHYHVEGLVNAIATLMLLEKIGAKYDYSKVVEPLDEILRLARDGREEWHSVHYSRVRFEND